MAYGVWLRAEEFEESIPQPDGMRTFITSRCPLVDEQGEIWAVGGVQAVEKIVALDPGAKVVVSSGYSTDPAMAPCEDYGFKTSLVKPFTLREMSRVLESVLSA